MHNIVGTTVQVIWLNAYSLWVLKDLNVSVATTCLHISHLVPPHDLREHFFFSRGTNFALTRISFKLLALLNPTIGILSKTFRCSLSGVNSKCISDSTFLSFKITLCANGFKWKSRKKEIFVIK